MKKTTKKLISIFLSLLMVLSLIPTGMMTAFAALHEDATCSSNPLTAHYHITGYDEKTGKYDCTLYHTNGTSSSFTDTLSNYNVEVGKWYIQSGPYLVECNGHGDSTPEWVDTIISKVDAVADTLATAENEPFTDILGDGTFEDFCNILTELEYSNEGSNYTIKGKAPSGVIVEFIVTLDADENVASVVQNAYFLGELAMSNTYTPAPAGPETCGLCVICGHAKSEHGSYCEPCDMTSGECGDKSKFAPCALDKDHTGNHKVFTPDWVETINAKVEAVANDLITDISGNKYAFSVFLYSRTFTEYCEENIKDAQYTNEGSVYTIKNSSEEFIITLDTNENIASVVMNSYNNGSIRLSRTFEPAPNYVEQILAFIEGKNCMQLLNVTDDYNCIAKGYDDTVDAIEAMADSITGVSDGGKFFTTAESNFALDEVHTNHYYDGLDTCENCGFNPSSACGKCATCGHSNRYYNGSYCTKCKAEEGPCKNEGSPFAPCVQTVGHTGSHVAHTHTFATAWSTDATQHWHAATCGHTTEKDSLGNHSGGTATCTAAAVCSTCGASYGTALGHSYATTWSSDANTHWYAATCEHTTLKSSEANHTYGTTGTERYTCSVCSAVNETKKLQFAKADAKAAIDEYLGESENEDADAVANKAKQDIDAATTVEDVNAIKNKALVDLKDIIAPDFATLNRDIKYDGTVTKLTKDYTRAKAQQGIVIGDGDKVIIDLNGHTIDGANDNITRYGFIFAVNPGGELVIMDSTDNEGVITGGTGYLNGQSRWGGAIYNKGTVTINGGTFTGNTANNGGVIGNYATLTINSGVFTNNSSTNQGGVVDSSDISSVTLITGGTFTNNTSSLGGVVENYNSTDFTIIGGTFTDNTATMNGGAIDNFEATLYIGGSAVVKDNKVGENINNLELESGTVALADTPFTEDADIGVSFTYVVDTFIAEGATLDTLKALKSDNASKMFIVEDGAVKLQNIADHVHSFGETGEDRYTCQTCGVVDEDEKAAVELADAKADALDAIKEAVGECEEKAVLDVADEYASAINEAESIEDVEAITEEAIKAIQDAMHKHSYKKTIVKPATYNSTGIAKYTCSCGDTYNETIARLKVTSTVKYNNSTKMCASFKVSSSTKDVTAKWGKVADADGYIVYAAYCGKDFKAIKTIKGADTTSYSFTKLDGKKLDLNKNFKVYVVAYKVIDGKKVEFGKSLVGHVIGGKNTKYTNPTKVTVKNSKVTLAVNKTSKISATVTYKYEGKKHISDAHAPEKRYRSSNRAVATVDKNGKITAVGKGTCTIYVFAKNGNPTKVTVTVK